MPATSPRIYLTIPDEELADAIRRIGLGSGMSSSAVVVQMLTRQRNALLSLADAMDKARAIQGPVALALKALLATDEQELDTMAAEAMGKLDQLHMILDQAMEEQGVEAPARRPQEGRAGASSAHSQQPRKRQGPPPFNKGVRSDPNA